MVARLAAILILGAGLAACKEPDSPAANPLFHGVGDVRVIDGRIVQTGDASAQTSGGTLSYLVVRIEFTNDLGSDLVPQVDHFFYVDRSGTRFQATDTGSSVFTGISNSQLVLKQNEKREYTIGFRTTDPNTAGTISYER